MENRNSTEQTTMKRLSDKFFYGIVIIYWAMFPYSLFLTADAAIKSVYMRWLQGWPYKWNLFFHTDETVLIGIISLAGYLVVYEAYKIKKKMAKIEDSPEPPASLEEVNGQGT